MVCSDGGRKEKESGERVTYKFDKQTILPGYRLPEDGIVPFLLIIVKNKIISSKPVEFQTKCCYNKSKYSVISQ